MRKYEKYIGEEFGSAISGGNKLIEGIKIKPILWSGIKGLNVEVKENNALNRPVGNYYTFDLPEFTGHYFKQIIKALSKGIKSLIKINPNKILVLGMGNSFIISDSLGPKTIEHLPVLEIMQQNKNLKLAKICPSVFSVSGLESYDISKAIVNVFEPDIVFVVDSLCTKNSQKLGKSFQISDAGISPGSAVGGWGYCLSKKTLGCEQVISVGVPLVIYLENAISEIVNKIKPLNQADLKVLLENLEGEQTIFSPKDIDFLVDFSSRIVSQSIIDAICSI